MTDPLDTEEGRPWSPEAETDALVAIELARERGVLDEEQLARLAPLVRFLRREVTDE